MSEKHLFRVKNFSINNILQFQKAKARNFENGQQS